MLDITTERKETKDGKLNLSQVPTHNIVIKSVTVETHGVNYSKAKVAKA